jgi:mannose-6-phosphate isomerase-like protein (cupin superfamily)
MNELIRRAMIIDIPNSSSGDRNTPRKETMNNSSTPLKAFKRAPSLGLSMWYMGILTTNLAETKDTNGAFCLVEATLAPGTEPPPHVHSREDELFYVLEGEFDVYVGEEAFKVETGECIFLPRFKPHAFVIRSPRIRVLTLFTPAGLEEAFRSVSSPAQQLELPTGALTYAKADFEQTAQRLIGYGARFLAPDEVADQLPLYPQPLPPNPGKSRRSVVSEVVS